VGAEKGLGAVRVCKHLVSAWFWHQSLQQKIYTVNNETIADVPRVL
jgi:hypothetical protein